MPVRLLVFVGDGRRGAEYFLRLVDTLEAMTETGKNVRLAAPRGYCAGVDRAVETVEKALLALLVSQRRCIRRLEYL